METSPVLIAGAGITGLSIAYALQKQGIPYVVMETAAVPGGILSSFHQDGFELDAGPNSIAATPATMAYLQEIGLEKEILHATAASKNRFLVRHQRLHAVSPHPFKIMGSPYLSRSAKWRLFTERFRRPVEQQGEESVTDFVSRRFNKEIADYLFDPILSGIYAGNPDRMSVSEVLPMLPRWEKNYGSVTKGLMKEKGVMSGRSVISLKGGNARLAQQLADRLRTPVRYNCTVKAVQPAGGQYRVTFEENGAEGHMTASKVIITTPAYHTADMIAALEPALAERLRQIHYPRMGVLHLGYDAAALPQPLEGFGFLVPNKEQLHFLGAICNSAIFPEKAPAGKVLLTVFTGGARLEQLFDRMGSDALQQQIIQELQVILQLQAPPVMQRFSVWNKGIPQLNVGHAQLREAVAAFTASYPGIILSGNYLHGVAVSALIQHADAVVAEVKKK